MHKFWSILFVELSDGEEKEDEKNFRQRRERIYRVSDRCIIRERSGLIIHREYRDGIWNSEWIENWMEKIKKNSKKK